MSERLKELVSKTSVRFILYRGFESPPLRSVRWERRKSMSIEGAWRFLRWRRLGDLGLGVAVMAGQDEGCGYLR